MHLIISFCLVRFLQVAAANFSFASKIMFPTFASKIYFYQWKSTLDDEQTKIEF